MPEIISQRAKEMIAEISAGFDLRKKISHIEKGYVWAAMYAANGLRPRAAALLGISTDTLRKLLHRYDIAEEFPELRLGKDAKDNSRIGQLVADLRAMPFAERVRVEDWPVIMDRLQKELGI